MIPAIRRLLVQKDSGLNGSDLSVLKLSNGVSYRNPKINFITLRDGSPYLFIKATRFARDGAYIQQAYDGLSRANEIVKNNSELNYIPVPVWRDDVSDHAVCAETLVGGRPMDGSRPEEVGKALAWLDGFTEACHTAPLPVAELERRLKVAYDEAGIGAEAQAELEKRYKECVGVWGQTDVPTCQAHGDFTHSNVLFSERGVGVIDWDGFGTIDAPLFDLLTLVDRVTAEGQNPYHVHRTGIEHGLSRLGADWRLVGLAGFLYVAMTDWRKRSKGQIADKRIWDERLLQSVARHSTWINQVFHG